MDSVYLCKGVFLQVYEEYIQVLGVYPGMNISRFAISISRFTRRVDRSSFYEV